jgi:hypothetical protein
MFETIISKTVTGGNSRIRTNDDCHGGSMGMWKRTADKGIEEDNQHIV